MVRVAFVLSLVLAVLAGSRTANADDAIMMRAAAVAGSHDTAVPVSIAYKALETYSVTFSSYEARRWWPKSKFPHQMLELKIRIQDKIRLALTPKHSSFCGYSAGQVDGKAYEAVAVLEANIKGKFTPTPVDKNALFPVYACHSDRGMVQLTGAEAKRYLQYVVIGDGPLHPEFQRGVRTVQRMAAPQGLLGTVLSEMQKKGEKKNGLLNKLDIGGGMGRRPAIKQVDFFYNVTNDKVDRRNPYTHLKLLPEDKFDYIRVLKQVRAKAHTIVGKTPIEGSLKRVDFDSFNGKRARNDDGTEDRTIPVQVAFYITEFDGLLSGLKFDAEHIDDPVDTNVDDKDDDGYEGDDEKRDDDDDHSEDK